MSDALRTSPSPVSLATMTLAGAFSVGFASSTAVVAASVAFSVADAGLTLGIGLLLCLVSLTELSCLLRGLSTLFPVLASALGFSLVRLLGVLGE